MITALAGGVGAARFLVGLVRAVDPERLRIIGNTGDDEVLHGLHISPDLDTVTYTLAGSINPDTGWGLAGDTWEAMGGLQRYGGATWFRLGDRDLGTHLYRTQRIAQGAPLSVVTAEVARAWGLTCRIMPMSDDPVRTRLTLAGPDATGGREGERPGDEEVAFQDYFVRRRHAVAVRSVRFAGADTAVPGPGVLEAIAGAERLVICPSNPAVSIAPILAVPGIREALVARRADTVAISPIVAGRAVKGPADRLLAELGHEPSVVGIARLWSAFAAVLVVDTADAANAPAVEAEGMSCLVTPTLMSCPGVADALGRLVMAPR